MKMEPLMPKRNATFTWAPRRRRDLSQDDATKAVMHGESICVHGIAGVGKTHSVLGLVQQLNELRQNIDIVAKTHTASSRAGGVHSRSLRPTMHSPRSLHCRYYLGGRSISDRMLLVGTTEQTEQNVDSIRRFQSIPTCI